MKRDSYTFGYWIRVQRDATINLHWLANCILEDCDKENPSIDDLLDYFNDNLDSYLLNSGLPSECLEEDGDYLCNKIYNEISGDLATILDELLNS